MWKSTWPVHCHTHLLLEMLKGGSTIQQTCEDSGGLVCLFQPASRVVSCLNSASFVNVSSHDSNRARCDRPTIRGRAPLPSPQHKVSF